MKTVWPFRVLVTVVLTTVSVWPHSAHAQNADLNVFDLERSSIICMEVIGRAHYAEEFQRQLTVSGSPRLEIDRFFSIIVKIDQASEWTINQRFPNNDTDSPAGFSVFREGKIQITIQTPKAVAGRSGTITQSASSEVRPKHGFLFFVAPGVLTETLRREENTCEPDSSRTTLFETLDQHVEAQVDQALDEVLRQSGDDRRQ